MPKDVSPFVLPSPIEKINLPLFSKHQLSFYIKRDDLIHPQVSGNKWRKLKFNVEALQRKGKRQLLTFGGAFSNHILATAVACQLFNIPAIGVIRGEEPPILSSTLQAAQQTGMTLIFVSRTSYRNKKFLYEHFTHHYPDAYILPEGGYHKNAIPGVAELLFENENTSSYYDYYVMACGTGTTMAGIIYGLNNLSKVLGFSALKGDFHSADISKLLLQTDRPHWDNWQIFTNYHFGGYAKLKPELISFIQNFYQQTHLKLDPIYTAKAMYGLFDLVQQKYFPKGSKILFIHTGGLQGVSGMEKRYGVKFFK